MKRFFSFGQRKWRVFVTTFFVFAIFMVPGTKTLIAKFVTAKAASADDKAPKDDTCETKDKKNRGSANRNVNEEDSDGCNGSPWLFPAAGGATALAVTMLAIDNDADNSSADVSSLPGPPVGVLGASAMARGDSCSTGRFHSRSHHGHSRSSHSHYRPNSH